MAIEDSESQAHKRRCALDTVQPEDIRPLAEADAGRWRDLRLRMLREHPDAFGSAYEQQVTRPIEVFARRLRAEEGAPDNVILGAFDGEQLVGSIGLWRDDGAKDRHKAAIISMYTAPEVRGRGIGKALLQAAIARARAADGIEQLLLAVTAHNTPARNLYAALGFESYGVERHALKIGDRYYDEELMVLWLNEPPEP
jgi:RimJ/RimL family protein N-acetyltransferase